MSERVTEERHGYEAGPGFPRDRRASGGQGGPSRPPFQMNRAISGPPTNK